MMALTLLGLSSIPAPARPAAKATAEEPPMVEMGTTGTGIFGQGYIRELGEYNPEFSGGPFTAYRTYEQMRRGDAQVAATVMAMKLPVRCAEWKFQPPKDATPIEKECTEYIEQCFENIDFDRALENILLALDFGAACHEDVWTVTNGRVAIAKLAARMPLTFFTWTVDEQENLLELVQHGFHGGSFTEFQLPADKIALYTFRQEGSNFAGRAILREMYQHWFTKAALYKIDAIAAERNGMGVPVGTLPPNAGKEDRERFQNFLQMLAVHQRAYLMLPNGGDFDLKGVIGQVRDCKESIAHHNMQISMAGLAQFMIMGQSGRGSGNRSLGETMSDFFYLSLQTLANQVGDAFSDNTIARLARYNYGPTVRPPRLVPQQLIAMKFETVSMALSQLGAAGLLTWDPDIELWVRQKMGAPAMDRAELVRLKQAATTSGPGPGKGPGGGPAAGNAAAPGAAADGSGGGASGAAGGPEKGKDKSLREEVTEPGASAAKGAGPDLAASEINSNSRVPTKREAGSIGSPAFRRAEKCLAAAEILSALDKGRDDVAAALRRARPRVQAEIVNKLVNTPVRNLHRVSIAADEKLLAEVEEILRGIADFGIQQVADERARQRAGKEPGTAAEIRQVVAADRNRDQVGLYADAVVSKFENNLTARAATAAANRMRKTGGDTKGEVIQGIGADLDGQSDKWIDGVAGEGANEAFAEGRSEGFDQYRDEISRYIQSAMLDINTCEACAATDGMEAESEDDLPGAPNPECDGKDLCRDVVVAVFKDEGSVA